MKLFDLNSPLMQALGKLADICICNIMFCIFCLPIFTIGAALTALFRSMQILISDEDDGMVFREFWFAFKKNFKQSTLIWLICIAVFLFLAVFYFTISMFTGMLHRVYIVGFFVLCIVFLFGFQYFFPMQAMFRNKIRYTLKNSWLLSIAALPWTLLSILVPGVLVYISFFMNTNAFNLMVFVWAVCGFGVVAYLNSFFFRQAFKRVVPEEHHEDEGKSRGSVFTDEQHRKNDLMVQESTYSAPDWNRRDISGSEQDEHKGKKKHRR